jgi:hypothetical protein
MALLLTAVPVALVVESLAPPANSADQGLHEPLHSPQPSAARRCS